MTSHDWSRRTVLGTAGGLVLAGAVAAVSGPAGAATTGGHGRPGWGYAEGIARRVRPPRFPNRRFPVTRFGAAGDGTTLCTEAFDRAVKACHAAGGGHVIVPAGTFLTGPIHLLDNVDLHLEKDARITFSTNAADYLPAVYSRWQGIECYNCSPLIYAYGRKNIAVTGSGTLDGQATWDNWWSWNGDDAADAAWATLQKMAADGVPVKQRVFGDGNHLRPNFIQFYRCRNVLVEGVTIVDSPMWEIHPVLSENVTVQDVTVVSKGPNNDGCDPESCRGVVIRGCSFDVGDDCIAIKSGRDDDGRRVGVPCTDVLIENTEMINRYGAIAIGSETSGGVANVYARNSRMGGSDLHYGLYVKTNSVRGGLIENIYLKDIAVSGINHEFISMNLNHGEGDTGEYDPIVRNIEVRDLTCESARAVASMVGYERDPIRDVRLRDCVFRSIAQDSEIQYVDGLSIRDVLVNGAPMSL
ncbi:exopolygalacturonase PelB [Actinoallomurus oryzae]|uniref:Exopolygalacturonase PelB n=1 Tax=Actinoallomurus oryzae TaxID=502180 RepID=A0ABP8PRG8_9ACTN